MPELFGQVRIVDAQIDIVIHATILWQTVFIKLLWWQVAQFLHVEWIIEHTIAGAAFNQLVRFCQF